MATVIFDIQNSRVIKNDAGVEKSLVVFSIKERPELGKMSVNCSSLVPTGAELRAEITGKLAKIDDSVTKNTALKNQLQIKDNLTL